MELHTAKKRKIDHEDSKREGPGIKEDDSSHHGNGLQAGKIVSSQQAHQISNDSYNSSMFKLQLDELLAEVRPSYENKLVPIDNALRRLKAVIERIPDRDPVDAIQAEKDLARYHKLAIPFVALRRDIKYKLGYCRPANINVVGSYAWKSSANTDDRISIDMALTMPSSLFQEKDYLNYRYFHKRAFYLACIARGIQAEKDCGFKVRFECLNGNSLQPILVVDSTGDGTTNDFASSRCNIHIILAIPENTFPKEKLLPNKNCVRSVGGDSGKAKPQLPTPFYNATLISESCVTAYLGLVHATSARCDSYRDACMLGRIWLRQRGFGSSVSSGGFGHFEWTAISAMLLQGGVPHGQRLISPGYSSYQIFKAMVQFLATRDLAANPLVLEHKGIDMQKAEVPMFLDGRRGHNILFKMTQWSYELLRHEAITSLKMLNDPITDMFEGLFIIRTDEPLQRYDLLARIPISLETTNASQVLDYEPISMQFSKKLYQVLARGLGDRVNLIHLSISHSESSFPAEDPALSPSHRDSVVVGFLLDPANAARSVDHGPSAEAKHDASSFRKFWGEKAELRRFKDGSILESLVWSDKDSKIPVLQQVILYLLGRHLGTEVAKAAFFVGDMFSSLVPMHGLSGVQTIAGFQPLKLSFETLQNDVKNIEGLPLQLSQISAASPKLRYTSADIPVLSSRLRAKMDPAAVVVHFEGSGRWPDDIAAIQRTKLAISLRLADLLEEAIEEIVTRTGLENSGSVFRNSSILDVVYPNGAAFRLRIHSEREQTLLERVVKEKSLDQRSREEAVLALSEYRRTFIQSPLHSQALGTLCTRFAFLSPVVRLVKKWIASHLLSLHISEELIELFVVRVFLQPYPWERPSSVMAGFLRTLLLLSRWDWRLDPLIIDFSGEMKAADIEVIKIRFEAWRKVDPGMNRVVLFVASNLDPEGLTWTQAGPSKVVAARMTALARSACAVVKKAGLDLEVSSLFVSSTSDYDFVIHLNSRFRGNRRGEKTPTQDAKFKNLQLQSNGVANVELFGFDPVQLFLEELKHIYSNNIVFFHNAHGGSVIGGLWVPQTSTPRPWKVNLSYSTTPIPFQGEPQGDSEEAAGLVIINKAAILNEIGRIGGDMVTRIEIKN